jgi:hypothetical protein
MNEVLLAAMNEVLGNREIFEVVEKLGAELRLFAVVGEASESHLVVGGSHLPPSGKN